MLSFLGMEQYKPLLPAMCALSSGTKWIRHSVYVCWRKKNGTAAEEMLAKYGFALFVATVKIINLCLNIICTVIIYS